MTPLTGRAESRPGRMTAVMRVATAPTRPRCLRIGVLRDGRIVDERLVSGRAPVTVGRSERASFVVDVRSSATALFERRREGWVLHRVEGMSGRVAIDGEIVDLSALPAGVSRRIVLDESARGRVHIGDTTLLFQLVAGRPISPAPRLPPSLRHGVTSQIDWTLTVLAALSFLLHFGFVGVMYSDWMDPAVDEGMVAGIVDMIERTTPPPVETADATPATASPSTATSTTAAPSVSAVSPPRERRTGPDPGQTDALLAEFRHMRIDQLFALSTGPRLQGLLAETEGAPVDLDALARRPDGVRNGADPLGLPEASGPVVITDALQQVQHSVTTTVATTAGTVRPVVPLPIVQTEPPVLSAPVANAEAVIRRELYPRARRCYQKGIDRDSTQAGKIVLFIRVAPSGDVSSVGSEVHGNLSSAVTSCVVGAAQGLHFDQPGPIGAQIRAGIDFLHGG
jgi:hypothetical protein